MINIIKSKKGASSILVILLLVVLVVFGVAALTTALSNVRLGQKVTEWNDKYYAAEAQANERFAQIDNAVKTASSFLVSSGDTNVKIFADSVKSLDFEVETKVHETGIDFVYETWQGNVGIRVTLTLDTIDLTVTQWKAMQR